MKEPIAQSVQFLLVDDSEKNLVALEALLRRDGLSLLKAYSGAEALELLLKHDVALALIDVQMPDMDGFELAELMRGTQRTRRVPIIFLTAGNADQQRRFRGYEAGAVDFLQKPIEPDILRSKADVFFELHRQRQEVARQRDELASMVAENSRLLDDTRQFAKALQEADRRKDEFLATLAHELRNPLAPIRNGLQILKLAAPSSNASSSGNSDFPGDIASPEHIVQHACAMMERQLQQMVRLVDDLLDVSRITRGKVELRKGRVDLAAVLNSAVETARPLVEQNEHRLTVRLPSSPVYLDADPTRLAQVFSNLLNNAAKYTEKDGHIEITAAQEADEVVVRVKDSGVGIPPDMLPKVFDLFTQVDHSLERSQGGLGIGLTLVRRLVELHGGSVQAESEGTGRGSEFVVRLPALDSSLAGAESNPDDQAASSTLVRRRILVVDDNEDSAHSLSMLLGIIGNDVRVAHDGEAAVAVASEFAPDVILMDIGMPKMNGYEACQAIRRQPGGGRPVIAACTGWGQDEDRLRARDAGFNFHMVKPVDPSTLEKLLAGLADSDAR